MRTRITVVATAILLAVLAVTGLFLVTAQRAVLTDNVDEVLQRHVAEISRQIDRGTLGSTIPAQGDDDSFARVVDSAGTVVASTPTAHEGVVVGPARNDRPRFETVKRAAGAVEYRAMSLRHGDVSIVVGTPLDDVEDSVRTLEGGLALALPAASLLLAVLVWLLVGRVLRPVEEIRRQVAGIGGRSLDRRVPEPGTRDEIARLAHTMNEMLARVEASSERQRRFVADASHELRTPLTRMRTELEVDLAHPGSADLAATSRSVLEDAYTLQRLVDDLLLLARTDESRLRGRREPVDLDDVVLAEARLVGVPVDVSGVSGAQVCGDASQLSRVARNLLDNAVRHGGSAVAITLGEEGDHAVFTVTDDGPGIPRQLHDRVFERFARADEARAASDGGAGLGLAIARELVIAHGGTIAIDAEHSPGTRFVVRLPLRCDP